MHSEKYPASTEVVGLLCVSENTDIAKDMIPFLITEISLTTVIILVTVILI